MDGLGGLAKVDGDVARTALLLGGAGVQEMLDDGEHRDPAIGIDGDPVGVPVLILDIGRCAPGVDVSWNPGRLDRDRLVENRRTARCARGLLRLPCHDRTS